MDLLPHAPGVEALPPLKGRFLQFSEPAGSFYGPEVESALHLVELEHNFFFVIFLVGESSPQQQFHLPIYFNGL
jgi:hypothetical protein